MNNRRAVVGFLLAGFFAVSLTGCPGSAKDGKKDPVVADPKGAKPVFTLAWSEYPSWSVFEVASRKGLINGAEGKLGTLEEKWGVDIKLIFADYEDCIKLYNSGKCDAVCITNMDVLSPAVSLKSVAILPTSTSVGADACIVVGIPDVKELRKHKVYGLKGSVSEYVFARNLEKLGEKDKDHKFSNMDPAEAAKSMKLKVAGIDAIMVWNPFVLQTLKDVPSAKVLFDSSTIPEEIIDMVVLPQKVLDKPFAKEFACAIVDTYYSFNRELEDKAKRDELLVALGSKFGDLKLDDMKKALEQTRFYNTPEEGLKLFTGEAFQKSNQTVHDFCLAQKIIDNAVKMGYGTAAEAKDAPLRFDPSYIKLVRDKK